MNINDSMKKKQSHETLSRALLYTATNKALPFFQSHHQLSIPLHPPCHLATVCCHYHLETLSPSRFITTMVALSMETPTTTPLTRVNHYHVLYGVIYCFFYPIKENLVIGRWQPHLIFQRLILIKSYFLKPRKP